MKRAVCVAAGMMLALSAQAEQIVPSRYEFDKPEILAHQLVWGIVHGVRLLGMACHRRGDQAAALAYADWLDDQWPRILAAERDLSRHYFGREQAPLEAIDQALKLKPALDQPDEELGDACATLPAALTPPRYDLEIFYQENSRP
ncbi:MAG: hypothetical protein LBP94_04270 [Zoogloeaceae bacterium]|nr:hypothetical protein [Zoogloeaceae bacterium]